MSFREQLHESWREILKDYLELLDAIEHRIAKENYLPKHNLVMRALSNDFHKSRLLILGQDPYPSAENATGLAFSIPSEISKVPPSLKNIFIELESDIGLPTPKSGDLTKWSQQGVILLNRTLTCRVGESNSHLDLGWREFTEACVKELSKVGVVAILWGANAQELKSYFSPENLICSAHPSPLSAYRGFFGSKPFSRANVALVNSGFEPIDWSL